MANRPRIRLTSGSALITSLLLVSAIIAPPTQAAKKKRTKPASRTKVELSGQAKAPSGPLVLWYRRPASDWRSQALPVGNGRLGCMVFGGVAVERLALNEDTVWSGAPVTGLKDQGLASRLPGVRRLLFEHKFAEAEKMLWEIIEPVSKAHDKFFGCSQVLGNLDIHFDGPAAASDYRRDLDLDSAIARVRFVKEGITFTREVFSSAPDQVIVARFASDQRGKISFTAKLTRSGGFTTRADDGDALVMSGRLHGSRGQKNGLRCIARVKAITEGGTVATQDDRLRVEGADAVTLLIAGGTDYLPRPPTFCGNPHEKITAEQINAAAGKSYAALRSAHLAAHRALFRRVDVDLGATTDDRAQLPTDRRLAQFKKDADDPGLVVLLFQYGRYLLMSSSRPGSQPANLQGIWIEGIDPSWNGDYHLDLNIQMNYWPAEVCNLSECALPVADLVQWMVPSGRETARLCHGAKGWTAHATTNPFGFTWPRPDNKWGYLPGDGAWVMQTVWEHYAFTLDEKYLRRVWPLFREAGEFWLSWLVPDPKTGKLVSGPSSSPENLFIAPDGSRRGVSMGPAYDQQCVWELFTEILEAAKVLGIEDDYVKRIRKARANLLGPQVGRDGRLLEWAREYKEADPRHRHRAHLVALYPGRQITPQETPEFAQAAARSLDARGSSGVAWVSAWGVGLNARLRRGNKALDDVNRLLRTRMSSNLLGRGGRHFQIDSNFGVTAGIAEMLLQSHSEEIELAPALPKAWKDGSFKGLCARGGFVLDLTWKDGKPIEATLFSKAGTLCRIRSDREIEVRCRGAAVKTVTRQKGHVEFPTQKGKTYNLVFRREPT